MASVQIVVSIDQARLQKGVLSKLVVNHRSAHRYTQCTPLHYCIVDMRLSRSDFSNPRRQPTNIYRRIMTARYIGKSIGQQRYYLGCCDGRSSPLGCRHAPVNSRMSVRHRVGPEPHPCLSVCYSRKSCRASAPAAARMSTSPRRRRRSASAGTRCASNAVRIQCTGDGCE